ncbi:uncharacterized protein [Chiloscyllium punctatum]|uniref:uncharacterized protein isoform X2 n=1 Tax=Chiloscyllium punctatum TaxID=137246 RepID=UPI003B63345D
MSAVEEREPAPAASSAAAGAQELNNPPELEEGPSSKKRGVRLEAGFAQGYKKGRIYREKSESKSHFRFLNISAIGNAWSVRTPTDVCESVRLTIRGSIPRNTT